MNIATLVFPSTSGKKKDVSRFTVPAGQSILAAMESLRLPSGQPHVPVVNGKTEELAYILQPGDVVTFLPQIAGG